MDCIFCKIAKEEIKAYKIYESDHYIAFLDVNPVVIGHAVLIPKRHVETIYDLDKNEQAELGIAIYDISGILKKKFGPNINISNTSGEYASQSVLHFHVHLIPRREGDRLWDGDKSKIVLDRSSGFERLKPTGEELEALAREIYSA